MNEILLLLWSVCAAVCVCVSSFISIPFRLKENDSRCVYVQFSFRSISFYTERNHSHLNFKPLERNVYLKALFRLTHSAHLRWMHWHCDLWVSPLGRCESVRWIEFGILLHTSASIQKQTHTHTHLFYLYTYFHHSIVFFFMVFLFLSIPYVVTCLSKAFTHTFIDTTSVRFQVV